MKRFFIFQTLLVFISGAFLPWQALGQTPQKMSYQAVIRNSSGQLVVNHAIGMRITIVQGSVTGNAVYVETHTPTANANGLVTVEIGGGTVISGSFEAVDWPNGPYYIKTETDPAGGTNYSIAGTSQILSVPYALNAREAENGFASVYTASEKRPILSEDGRVSLGISNDSWNKLNVNGRTNILPGDQDWGSSMILDASPLSGGQRYMIASLSDKSGEGAGKFLIRNDDGSSLFLMDTKGYVGLGKTNPAYKLDVSGDINFTGSLYKNGIPYGGGAGSDNWGTQSVLTDATLVGNGTTTSPLKLAQQSAATGQVLKWNGTTWAPGDIQSGSSVWSQIGKSIFYNAGNVGIGTNTPGAKLEVAGSAKINGTLDMQNKNITNIANPVNAQDAATKAYVDMLSAKLAALTERVIALESSGGGGGGGDNTVTDRDDNVYSTIKIGNQIWMAENLKVTHYNNGDDITLATNPSEWISNTAGAYCWYNNNTTYRNIYGAYYNWFAVNNDVCPIGWHVPTDVEWTIMQNYLITNGYNFDGTRTGNKIAKSLASITGWWSSPNVGSIGNIDYPEKRNATGFTAIPASFISDDDGFFQGNGSAALFWTSTESSPTTAIQHFITYNEEGVLINASRKNSGFSIRCVKDN